MEKELKAIYDSDSKGYHRFIIRDECDGLTGIIYVSKEEVVPDSVKIKLRAKAEVETNQEMN